MYKRRTGTQGSQSGPNHSHSMVSVPLLSLNLLICYCMHLFRLRCFTIGIFNILYWLFALNPIWLYIRWHKYVRLPLCDEYKKHWSLRTILAKLYLLSLSPSLLLFERFRTWASHELPSQLGIVRIPSLYSLLLIGRFQLWASHELPSQLGIVRVSSLYSLNGSDSGLVTSYLTS